MPPRKRPSPDRLYSRTGRSIGRSEQVPIDVADRGDEFLLSAELPGLRKQDLDLSVRNDRLRIVADFSDNEDGTYLRKERERGTVRRVVRLPEPIDEKHVSASYNDGILWVTLKKEDRPTRVDVQ